MTSKDKYERVVWELRTRGFERHVSVADLKSVMMGIFTFHQESAFRFHVQNMEMLKLIRLKVPGVWEIVSPETDPAIV